MDYTNVIYAIVWKLLLEEAPADFRNQSITRLSSAGNMIEGLMGIVWLGSDCRYQQFRENIERKKWARDVWGASHEFMQLVKRKECTHCLPTRCIY